MSSDDSKKDSKKASSKLVGLHPAVSSSCRAALREVMSDLDKPNATEDSVAETSVTEASVIGHRPVVEQPTTGAPTIAHIEECGFCSARVKARASLAQWASARPRVPAALASPSVLEGIYERAAEAVAHGPIGEWLEQAAVGVTEEVASVIPGSNIPGGNGTDSSFLDVCLSESGSPNELLGDFVRSPTQPDSRVWSGVCRSILEGVASERVVRRQTGWRLLLAGAAAAAVVGLLSLPKDAPVQPTFIFADLDRAPDGALANARYGSRY